MALPAVLKRNLRKLLHEDDLGQAAEVLERLRLEAPLALETRTLELEYLLQAKRHAEAAALAGQLLELHPGAQVVQYLAGLAAYRQRDYATAAARLTEAERLRPHWKHRRWLAKSLTQIQRFDQAEVLLLPLVKDHPVALGDLAWLYERQGDMDQALECWKRRLASHPDDRFAQENLRRLQARILPPAEIQEEMAALEALGEEPSPELVPAYVDALLATGQGAEARGYVRSHRQEWPREIVRQCAWTCHHHQAFDLSCELFLDLLPGELGNYKLLNALDRAARNAGQVDRLIHCYREHAEDFKGLYGRIKRLERALKSAPE